MRKECLSKDTFVGNNHCHQHLHSFDCKKNVQYYIEYLNISNYHLYITKIWKDAACPDIPSRKSRGQTVTLFKKAFPVCLLFSNGHPFVRIGPDPFDPLQFSQRDDPGRAESTQPRGVHAHLWQLLLQVSPLKSSLSSVVMFCPRQWLSYIV